MVALRAGLGLVALASRRPARLPEVIPTLAVWLGSGALAAWGLYHAVLLAVPNDLTRRPTRRAWASPWSRSLGIALVAGLWCSRPADRRPESAPHA